MGSDNKPVAPNCYVAYTWFTSQIATPVVRETCAPAWHHSHMCFIPPDAAHGLDPKRHPLKGTLELKLFHRALAVADGQLSTADLLIGSAKVDLSPLLYPSMDELNGWYHITDFKGEGQGEIKVQITPSEPNPRNWALPG
eukprot:SAG31_NODE_18883_length_619_cov_1.165385_2_plen_139_part_01